MKITFSSELKHPVEFLVWANPNPDPCVFAQPLGDRAVIARHTDRPKARVRAQPFEMETRMCRIGQKLLVGATSRRLDLGRQFSIREPEFSGAARSHSCLSNSFSDITGNCSGSARYAASTSSPSLVSAGRGRGSRIIRSHSASPSSSGTSVGSESASCARSVGESCRMAAWISSTVLTSNQYNGPRSPARRSQ